MTSKAINGAMPKWQQNVHAFALILMCLLLGAFGLLGARFLLRAREAGVAKEVLPVSLAFVVIASLGVGIQVWFRRRIVKEFSYDGGALRFCTLGIDEMQTRDLSEVADLREWRRRGGRHGYRLRFRDGEKIYLLHSVSNSVAAAEQIGKDLRT